MPRAGPTHPPQLRMVMERSQVLYGTWARLSASYTDWPEHSLMESWHSRRASVRPHLSPPQGDTELLRRSGPQVCRTTSRGKARCQSRSVACLWSGRCCSTSSADASAEGEEDPEARLLGSFQLKSKWKMLIEINGKVAGDGLEDPGPCPGNLLPKSGASYLPHPFPDVKCVARGMEQEWF